MNTISKKEIRKSNKIVSIAFGLIVLTIIFGAGYFLGAYNPSVDIQEQSSEDIVDYKLFSEVWELIKEKHYHQPVDETDMFYGAIEGITSSLGDPYSVFLDPELAKTFNSEINGNFEGIGAEIGIKNSQLVVIAPLPETPAERAGLKNGDIILAIDKTDTTNMSLEYAVSIIRGEAGTDVILTILSENAEETKEVTITRGSISVASVDWEMKNDLGYIEINHFNADTGLKFNEAVQEMLAKNPKGIILDLRNNPGGYLDQAILVASQFIEEGVVTYEEFSDKSSKEYKAVGQAQLADIPAVVLINGGSASASEIVAGALKDYELATLVGETTFGKGSVQEYQTFSDGSSLKLTVAKWLTPNKNSIDQEGIAPNELIELTLEHYNNDQDPQLDKAIEILNN